MVKILNSLSCKNTKIDSARKERKFVLGGRRLRYCGKVGKIYRQKGIMNELKVKGQ
jgi:hypothetical protein